ncbi:DJ-1/PfpI family protein [Methanolacinia paynteri]|uniref:DJ-1/PfpI family protein n=1 Tax=Methanolacinia paynteri TaxID=230356 RepID=UPI00064FB571|nr:DJ-1/PfpI family protein [Methanolacinia paynteri]
MKVLFVIAPLRYREEEFEVTARMLSEAGIEYDVASTKTGVCIGMMGGEQEAGLEISKAAEKDYDALILIGGLGARDFLWADDDLCRLTKEFGDSGKVIAAICHAPVIVARAGVLKGRQATVFESRASLKLLEDGGANYVNIPVVSDMNIITANHPVAAKQFAEAILEKLGC